MRTQTATLLPPQPIHTGNWKQCKRRLRQHRTDRGGSVWHVASQEVNHDWLTMMVPGSVAGHWLAWEEWRTEGAHLMWTQTGPVCSLLSALWTRGKERPTVSGAKSAAATPILSRGALFQCREQSRCGRVVAGGGEPVPWPWALQRGPSLTMSCWEWRTDHGRPRPCSLAHSTAPIWVRLGVITGAMAPQLGGKASDVTSFGALCSALVPRTPNSRNVS